MLLRDVVSYSVQLAHQAWLACPDTPEPAVDR
jgi:hypothetical protein